MTNYILNNTEFDKYVTVAWNNEAQRIADAGLKVPKKCGDGFMAGLAAKHDKCINPIRIDGNPYICGRNIVPLDDPYFCPQCSKARRAELETKTSEPQAQGEPVPF
jgi:hypothetical protein